MDEVSVFIWHHLGNELAFLQQSSAMAALLMNLLSCQNPPGVRALLETALGSVCGHKLLCLSV